MKVTQELGFNPVVIVLETEDEVRTLWVCLNRGWNLADLHRVEIKPALATKSRMWEELNRVYDPRQHI